MKVIKKIRKAQTHYVGEHKTFFLNWKGEKESEVHSVFIDTPQGGDIQGYADEKYIECFVFDDMRGKWYNYHIPLAVFDYFYKAGLSDPDVLFNKYIDPYGVKSYGTGKRSI